MRTTDSADLGNPVLFDGWCGEPIAWLRRGAPVLDSQWSKDHWVAFTHRVDPLQLVERYGPVTRLTLGVNGGFKSVQYGDKTFVIGWADPRKLPDLFSAEVVHVDDPMTDYVDCPKCGALRGQHCEGVGTRHKARRLAYERWLTS